MRGFLNSKANIEGDPNELGAVCILDMKQQIAGTVFDKSGNGLDGELDGNPRQGSDSLGDYLQCDGISDGLVVDAFSLSSSTPSIFSFLVDVKDSATDTKYLFDSDSGGADRITLAWRTATTGQIGLFDGAWRDAGAGPVTDSKYNLVFYLNGVDTFYVFANGGQIGTATYAPRGITTSAAIKLMKHHSSTSPTAALQGNLYNTQILDATGMTLAEVTTWAANQYALGKRALWMTQPVNNTGTVTSGQIGDSPFRVESGGFAVVDDSEVGKAIECITAGNLKFPQALLSELGTAGEDDNWEYWIDTGAGYVLTTTSPSSRLLALTTGDKIALGNQGGNYSVIKRLLP